MGFGDALLGVGRAKRARLRHPDKKICIGNGQVVEWIPEVHDGNPYLLRSPEPGCLWVHSHKSFRPYVDIEKSTETKYTWKRDFKAYPGELFLSEEELDVWKDYKGAVYIEPNIKGWLGPNKDWGFERWQAVVNALPEVQWVQGQGKTLEGVTQLDTESFRDACCLLAHCSLFVGTDGGLHHAAAALDKKAVVIWGGYTHPRNLGYETHTNLHQGGEPCGNVKACDHCKKAMDKITVEMVVRAISAAR